MRTTNTMPMALARCGLIATLLAGLTACDFKVTNPGPVQASFLDDTTARTAIINGAGRDLAEALNWIAYTSAATTRELFPGGSTGSFGISVQQQIGQFTIEESDTYWNNAQRARWTAEDGARRLQTGKGAASFATSKPGAQILLWAAYANRLLGETMCEAVINGGAAQPSTIFLQRADSEFTQALQVATAAGDTKAATAARAGRASVRADLGRWADASADAATVADAFSYQMPYYTTSEPQYNRIYWAGANQPYRAHTVWNTVNDQYFQDTGDPRVKWAKLADPRYQKGDAAVLDLGSVAFYQQLKYPAKDSPINLSTGWEMRLIEAEAKLVGNDYPSAMTLLNKHRTALGLTPWTASNATDAWARLKRERGIELWLEARRLGDLRRWQAANTPGELLPLELPGTTSHIAPNQSRCIPIPLSERQTNPNVKS